MDIICTMTHEQTGSERTKVKIKKLKKTIITAYEEANEKYPFDNGKI